MKKYALASTLILPIFARAEYGDELLWMPCGVNTWCGNVEFCEGGGGAFGYRADSSEECSPKNPGPLMRMMRGNTYKLTLVNTASPNQVTNIHTHGLHINGEGDSDNIVRTVDGGKCLDYTYVIPDDHPGGTYWYHPHKHGTVESHVEGGGYGMLIVEDEHDSTLGEWAWAHANEKLLQVFSVPCTMLFGRCTFFSPPSLLYGNGNENEGEAAFNCICAWKLVA